jgi:endonuclease YncB( thermonuclease family)
MMACVVLIAPTASGQDYTKGDTIRGKVVKVADGDTITVLVAGNKQVRVRLYGIDAPENKQAFGRKSGDYLKELVATKEVTVKVRDIDRYQRVVGEVSIFGSFRSVNLLMVEAGLAWHYVRYARNDHELAQAEQRARFRRVGLWADKDPVPPWEFRRKK